MSTLKMDMWVTLDHSKCMHICVHVITINEKAWYTEGLGGKKGKGETM